MQLLTNHKVRLNYLVEKPNELVREEIIRLTKQRSTKAEIIELELKPSFFDSTGERGIIRFQLSAVGDKQTSIVKSFQHHFPKKLFIL